VASFEMTVETTEPRQIVDVTDGLASWANDLGDGLMWIDSPHTTASLMICESDAKLDSDFVRVAERLIQQVGPFAHDRNNNPNAEAHILSAMIGSQQLLMVSEGALCLGTYQRVLLFELDGPKRRTLRCRFIRTQAVVS